MAPIPGRIIVPNVIGMLKSEAFAELIDKGLVPKVPGLPDEGRVISQDPTGGTTVDFGTAVLLALQGGMSAGAK